MKQSDTNLKLWYLKKCKLYVNFYFAPELKKPLYKLTGIHFPFSKSVIALIQDLELGVVLTISIMSVAMHA